ncbi:MAG: ATP-binding protein, partial [Chlorobiota bacterium]
FTKEGMIEIEINRLSTGNLAVSVIDSGIGMDPAYLNEIFNPFSQESKGYSREYDGIGLGLPVAKGFCELNNIELKISSQREAGTVVSLKFESFG